MKVGIIIEPYEENLTSGISYGIMSQASGLLKEDSINDYILYTHKAVNKDRFVGNFRNIRIPRSFIGKNLWFIIASFLRKKDVPDVLLFNMPLLPLIVPRQIRTIPIFYELSAYQTRDARMSLRTMLAKVYKLFERIAVRRASHIVTASSAVKTELANYFNRDEGDISVIYLGFQKFKEEAKNVSVFTTQMNHFLFVGRVKYKKNVHNIVRGFIRFRDNNIHATQKLFIVGLYGGDYYQHILQDIKRAGLEKDVVFTGFVTAEDLYQLYKNSLGLIFCSLQEGFGMPILEAMDLSVPVITSNRAPMNEVAGGAALTVDPEDITSIAEAMGTLAFDDQRRKELVKKGRKRASEFSWEKHVERLLAIIESIK